MKNIQDIIKRVAERYDLKYNEKGVEHDAELLSKNRPHQCNDYTIYFSLSRGWELYNILNDCVMRNISYCPFCGEKLDK